DFPLELADPGFTGVARDDFAQRSIGQRQLIGPQAVLAELPRDEITLGDLEFLAFGVAREIDGFETVEQRPGNALDKIRRRDEQDLGQVQRPTETAVDNRVALA